MTTEKHCRLCDRVRPIEEFYTSQVRRRGRIDKRINGYCKACERARTRLRPRGLLNPSTGKKRYPERERARHAVSTAVGSGRLIRQPCETCGAKAQAHHEDYGKPLEVRWLCRAHHAQAHWLPCDSQLMERVLENLAQPAPQGILPSKHGSVPCPTPSQCILGPHPHQHAAPHPVTPDPLTGGGSE